MPVRAQTRMRILNALPRRHQDYFFGEIRKLCTAHILSLRILGSDRASEASGLFSEVMAKFLGVASLHGSDEPACETDQATASRELREQPDASEAAATDVEDPQPPPTVVAVDDEDPTRDGRVAWLIQEIGSRRAIAHRYEDMRRQRWGRWQGSGYRTMQISALIGPSAESDAADEVLARHVDGSYVLQAEPGDPHDAEDIRRVWRGLLALAKREFEPDEDVSLLLQLLARDTDIQASFGSEWPIARIVAALNEHHPQPHWNDERVDNAKKRLRNWIGRMKRDHGLDATELKDVLARYGRERAVGREGPLTHSQDARQDAPPREALAND
jgi:hypothetical protein